MAFQKDPNEIGALWLKRGAKGEYLTGTIEGIGAVVCFAVSAKSDKAPTWRVLKSKPREVSNAPVTPLDAEDIGF